MNGIYGNRTLVIGLKTSIAGNVAKHVVYERDDYGTDNLEIIEEIALLCIENNRNVKFVAQDTVYTAQEILELLNSNIEFRPKENKNE